MEKYKLHSKEILQASVEFLFILESIRARRLKLQYDIEGLLGALWKNTHYTQKKLPINMELTKSCTEILCGYTYYSVPKKLHIFESVTVRTACDGCKS